MFVMVNEPTLIHYYYALLMSIIFSFYLIPFFCSICIICRVFLGSCWLWQISNFPFLMTMTVLRSIGKRYIGAPLLEFVRLFSWLHWSGRFWVRKTTVVNCHFHCINGTLKVHQKNSSSFRETSWTINGWWNMMSCIYFKIVCEWEMEGTDDAVLALTGHCHRWILGTLGFINLLCGFCIYLIFYHIHSFLIIWTHHFLPFWAVPFLESLISVNK